MSVLYAVEVSFFFVLSLAVRFLSCVGESFALLCKHNS